MLQQFTAIWVVDSTFKQLPASMAADYPGAGGKSSPASLKAQPVYEFLCGNLAQVTLQPGRCADQAYRDYLHLVQAGSLVLMDLGYFCSASLQAIAQAEAYFVVRYPSSTHLYTPSGAKIDLLTRLQAQGEHTLEQAVHIGAKCKIPLMGGSTPARYRWKWPRKPPQSPPGRRKAWQDPLGAPSGLTLLVDLPDQRARQRAERGPGTERVSHSLADRTAFQVLEEQLRV